MSEKFIQRKGFEELPDDHWFQIMSRIKEKFVSEKPSPMEIRANVILELAGIPSGQYSSLKTEEEGKRTDPESDKIIAEYLTNPAGLMLSSTKGITTHDFRDRYPDDLPPDVSEHLDEKTRKIIAATYEFDWFSRRMSDGDNSQGQIDLHFLPGGIPLFLVGYKHGEGWQRKYRRQLQKIGKEASIVAIEGLGGKSPDVALESFWAEPLEQKGDYDGLLKDLVLSEYSGLFTVVDGRDTSRVEMDNTASHHFPVLPGSFYTKYLAYLKRENPKLGAHIFTVGNLRNFLEAQSTSISGIITEKRMLAGYEERQGKTYIAHPFNEDNGEVSFLPTGNEFGQKLYSDALSAIRLHLLGKMMNEGYIDPKGPIVDYEGRAHLSSKSFFLQYPEYAMEIVLRTIPELLAGKADKKWLNYFSAKLHAENVFDHTDWTQVICEIFRIPLKKVNDPNETEFNIMGGSHQRRMSEVHPDSWVLGKILENQPEGMRNVEDWTNKIEDIIEKFTEKKK